MFRLLRTVPTVKALSSFPVRAWFTTFAIYYFIFPKLGIKRIPPIKIKCINEVTILWLLSSQGKDILEKYRAPILTVKADQGHIQIVFLRKSNSGGAISWKVGEGGNGHNP